MKKFILLLLVSLGFSVLQSQAQNTATTTKVGDSIQKGQYFRGPNFEDKNKDGICDNAANRNDWKPGPGFTDENKDGICDNREQRKGNNSNFKNKSYRNNCPGRGPCNGKGFRHRQGWRWQK